jgi:hypothetical protein
VKTADKEPAALMIKEYAVDADYYVLGHLDGREGRSTVERIGRVS